MPTGWGLLIWTLASIGCGFAVNFWTMLLCRIAMGVGEASIINLTGDDGSMSAADPEHQKSTLLCV